MKKETQILTDLKTYLKISLNYNYKDRLLESYYLIKQKQIKNKMEFDSVDIGIGDFDYDSITIFDRLKDENYESLLNSTFIEINSILNLPEDYGDILASFGTVGKTPYRKEYIKKGYIKKIK